MFEPLDFLARLAAAGAQTPGALDPLPRRIRPAQCAARSGHPGGAGKKKGVSERNPAERHQAMTWAQRLKRVFRIDIEQCERCGGKVRIIASIEDPQVIGRILAHLEQTKQARGAVADLTTAHRARGPPGQGRLDLN
jgi:hypothetical protein